MEPFQFTKIFMNGADLLATHASCLAPRTLHRFLCYTDFTLYSVVCGRFFQGFETDLRFPAFYPFRSFSVEKILAMHARARLASRPLERSVSASRK